MTIININARIIEAEPELFTELIGLFDAYRVWYGKTSDPEGARAYLTQRLQEQESVIYMAKEEGIALGFTQLYPLFSSVSMKPLWLLNDLYVAKDHRNQKVGTALLSTAQAFCKREKGKGLLLETGNDNPAQRLYQRMGWKKNTAFQFFFWTDEQG